MLCLYEATYKNTMWDENLCYRHFYLDESEHKRNVWLHNDLWNSQPQEVMENNDIQGTESTYTDTQNK